LPSEKYGESKNRGARERGARPGRAALYETTVVK